MKHTNNEKEKHLKKKVYALIEETLHNGEMDSYFTWWLAGSDKDSIEQKLFEHMDSVYDRSEDFNNDNHIWVCGDGTAEAGIVNFFNSKPELTKAILSKTKLV
jgi:hypothetical protein